MRHALESHFGMTCAEVTPPAVWEHFENLSERRVCHPNWWDKGSHPPPAHVPSPASCENQDKRERPDDQEDIHFEEEEEEEEEEELISDFEATRRHRRSRLLLSLSLRREFSINDEVLVSDETEEEEIEGERKEGERKREEVEEEGEEEEESGTEEVREEGKDIQNSNYSPTSCDVLLPFTRGYQWHPLSAHYSSPFLTLSPYSPSPSSSSFPSPTPSPSLSHQIRVVVKHSQMTRIDSLTQREKYILFSPSITHTLNSESWTFGECEEGDKRGREGRRESSEEWEGERGTIGEGEGEREGENGKGSDRGGVGGGKWVADGGPIICVPSIQQ